MSKSPLPIATVEEPSSQDEKDVERAGDASSEEVAVYTGELDGSKYGHLERGYVFLSAIDSGFKG
jgi:hypothetical protein